MATGGGQGILGKGKGKRKGAAAAAEGAAAAGAGAAAVRAAAMDWIRSSAALAAWPKAPDVLGAGADCVVRGLGLIVCAPAGVC